MCYMRCAGCMTCMYMRNDVCVFYAPDVLYVLGMLYFGGMFCCVLYGCCVYLLRIERGCRSCQVAQGVIFVFDFCIC